MIVFDRVRTIGYMDKSLTCALDTSADYTCLNNEKYTLLPGFCDVHVHLREPGFSYKETIKTGSKAAAHGGYTAVCTMPNLKPVCDNPEHLALQREIIERDACIAVYPYAAITLNQAGEELADLEALAPHVIAFSDDGHGVQSESMMREAMIRAPRAQGHLQRERVAADRAGSEARGRDRLRLPYLSHFREGERGPHPGREEKRRRCQLRDRTALSVAG